MSSKTKTAPLGSSHTELCNSVIVRRGVAEIDRLCTASTDLTTKALKSSCSISQGI